MTDLVSAPGRRFAVVATLLVAGGLAALLSRGAPGLVGFGIAIGAVVVFFAGGAIPTRAAAVSGALAGFLLLGLGYLLRILGLLVLLAALRNVSWVDRHVLGLTVVLAALAWSWLAIRAHQTSRQPIIAYTPPTSGQK